MAAHYQAAPRGGSEQRMCLLSVFAALRVIKLQVKASPSERLQLTRPTSWGRRSETLTPASLRFRFLRTTARMMASHRHLSGLALDRPPRQPAPMGALRFKRPLYLDATKMSRCTLSKYGTTFFSTLTSRPALVSSSSVNTGADVAARHLNQR